MTLELKSVTKRVGAEVHIGIALDEFATRRPVGRRAVRVCDLSEPETLPDQPLTFTPRRMQGAYKRESCKFLGLPYFGFEILAVFAILKILLDCVNFTQSYNSVKR